MCDSSGTETSGNMDYQYPLGIFRFIKTCGITFVIIPILFVKLSFIDRKNRNTVTSLLNARLKTIYPTNALASDASFER